MKVVSRIVLLVVVVGLAAGGVWYFRSRAVTTPTAGASGVFTQVVAVSEGSLSQSLSVVGELDASQSATLLFDRMTGSAKLATLGVAAGNTVQAGQVLATIDPAPYQQALDQAQSDLQTAQQALSDLQTSVTSQQIAEADLAVATAALAVDQANDALDQLVHPDLAALQSTVADAASALAGAQANLISLQTNTSYTNSLTTLLDTETTVAEEYNRLVAEKYTDVYYQDRLELAYGKMIDAQDSRVTYEVQRQVNLLNAQIQVRDAQATLADAQEALATARAGGDRLALAQAGLAVQTAQVTLAGARTTRADLDKGADTVQLAAAQAAVDKQRLAVGDAEIALAGTKLVAPFDGTVLQTTAVPGDLISSGSAVLTVANLKTLQVVASVDETTIRRVTAGQDAQITFDAFPGQTFQGQVLAVPLQGALQGGVMVYEVPVSLSGVDKLPLLVGMTANVQIQVGQVTNALLVPAMAVQKLNGRYQVLVPGIGGSSEPDSVPVEIGLSDGVNTQIVRGLNPGDQVVVQVQATQSGSVNLRGLGGLNPLNPGGGGNRQFTQPAGR